MAQERSDGGTAVGFGIGLVAGVALGVGIGLLLAPNDGEAIRKDLAERARKLKDEADGRYRRAGDVAAEWADRGRDVAERARTAAAEGLREARKHMAPVDDPRKSDLAGVEGTADGA
jgi:gas vesicle protein